MDSLSDLFSKNRHLLGEAFELDQHGNLRVKNTGKSTALDGVFRDFFVESMRGILSELVFDPKRRRRNFIDPDDNPWGSYGQSNNFLPTPQATSQAAPARPNGSANSPAPQPPVSAAPANGNVRPSANDNVRQATKQASQPVDYTPGSFIKTLGVSPDHYNAFREGIARIENARYDQMGGSKGKYAGRYQMGPTEIRDTSRLLGEPSPNTQQFLNDPQMQERYFEAYTLNHHNYLMNKNPKYANASPEEQLKVLGYAHNQGAGGASQWLNTGRAGTDAFGTSGKAYYDRIGNNLSQLKQQPGSQVATQQPQSPAGATGPQPAAAPQQIAANNRPSPYMAIGDSLAVGVGGKLGNTNYAQGGWNPERVMGLVNKAVTNGDVQGKHIILSGGASNAGGNSNMVASYYPQMIQALKDGGASQVTVMGVGPYSHYDNYKYNDIINKSAQSGGANFTGPLASIAPFRDNSLQNGVHPNDYQPIVNYVHKNFGAPPTPTNLASATQPSSPQPSSPQPSIPPSSSASPSTTMASSTPPAQPPSTPPVSSPTQPVPGSGLASAMKPLTTASATPDKPPQIESYRRPVIQMLRPYK